MEDSKKTYWIFYATFLIVVLAAVFLDKYLLVYFKPLPLISLTWLYCKYVAKINWLYPISMMLVMMINDTLVYLDFVKYFDIISIVVATYYGMSIFLLKKYISYEDFKIKKVISLPVVVSMLLISYLMYEIIDLTLSELMNSLFFFITVVVSMTLFVGICFFIYINDRYTEGLKLFIASYCCLFVNALLLINELYYYSRVFTVLINIVEICGFYFFLLFLIGIESTDEVSSKENYL